MFDFKNVSYKNILSIDKLHIPKYKITCIVGESGSGKTTLLRLLNRLISPDSGEILYNQKSLSEANPVDLRRQLVMLPQTPAIFEESVKDNLLIGLKFSEKPLASDDKLYEILNLVHLKKI
jgi:putative ABC transport system ATP-binding protein